MISPAVLAVADAVVVDVDAVVDQFCAGPPTKILERLGRVFFSRLAAESEPAHPNRFIVRNLINKHQHFNRSS